MNNPCSLRKSIAYTSCGTHWLYEGCIAITICLFLYASLTHSWMPYSFMRERQEYLIDVCSCQAFGPLTDSRSRLREAHAKDQENRHCSEGIWPLWLHPSSSLDCHTLMGPVNCRAFFFFLLLQQFNNGYQQLHQHVLRLKTYTWASCACNSPLALRETSGCHLYCGYPIKSDCHRRFIKKR